MAPKRLEAQGPMREADLRIIWLRRLFRQNGLLTEDSRRIAIESPGIPSLLGPDFRRARFALDGTAREGDVELHLFTSGWRSHRHRENLEYAGVQLHVALWREGPERPPAGCSGEAIAELVLEPFLERPLVDLLAAVRARYPDDPGEPPDLQSLGRLLDAAGDEWLQRKVRRFERLLKLMPAEEAAYRDTMSALGYSANKAQFEQLASLAPSATLRGKEAAEIESILMRRAGLAREAEGAMSRQLWRHRGVRPSNYPERRIRAAAAMMAACGGRGLFEAFRATLLEGVGGPAAGAVAGARRLMRRLSEWSAGRIGPERAGEIVFNVAAPLLIAQCAAERAFEAAQYLRDLPAQYPAPADNAVTRRIKTELFGAGRAGNAHSMRRFLGLIHWSK